MKNTIETLDVYMLSESFSDKVWDIAIRFDSFTKDTLGKQMTRSADSIGANIAEGYGRYFYKESKQFYFYSRGSIIETKSWLRKCRNRKIINAVTVENLLLELQTIHSKLNAYIKYVSKLKEKTK